jgi:hypothetical protein
VITHVSHILQLIMYKVFVLHFIINFFQYIRYIQGKVGFMNKAHIITVIQKLRNVTPPGK